MTARGLQQAFPLRTSNMHYEGGLTIREHFALEIYKAMMSNPKLIPCTRLEPKPFDVNFGPGYKSIQALAVDKADELLLELENRT